eukprot:SAG25_NODE_264_length_10707_cov_19.216043_2_plen_69_part_00
MEVNCHRGSVPCISVHADERHGVVGVPCVWSAARQRLRHELLRTQSVSGQQGGIVLGLLERVEERGKW